MIDYIIDKINCSILYNDPWDHLIIDDFLPQDKYLELVDIVRDTNTGIKPPGAAMEHQIIINTREATDNREFWDDWYAIFESQGVTDALRHKFSIGRPFDLMHCDIHKCEPGFDLGEHNDVKNHMAEIVSLQIYLPMDTVAAEDGVVLHGEQEKRIDYVPNRAWAFACGDNTFHSVPQCNRTRHSVLMKNVVMK